MCNYKKQKNTTLLSHWTKCQITNIITLKFQCAKDFQLVIIKTYTGEIKRKREKFILNIPENPSKVEINLSMGRFWVACEN